MTKRTPGISLQRSRVVGRRRLDKARVQVCLRREINKEEKQLTTVWLSFFSNNVFSSLSLWSESAVHAVCRQVIRPISSTANWANLVTAASCYSRYWAEVSSYAAFYSFGATFKFSPFLAAPSAALVRCCYQNTTEPFSGPTEMLPYQLICSVMKTIFFMEIWIQIKLIVAVYNH